MDGFPNAVTYRHHVAFWVLQNGAVWSDSPTPPTATVAPGSTIGGWVVRSAGSVVFGAPAGKGAVVAKTAAVTGVCDGALDAGQRQVDVSIGVIQ